MKANLIYPQGKKYINKPVIYDLWKIHFKMYYFMGYFNGILGLIWGCRSVVLRQGRFLFQRAVTLKLKEFP